MFYDPKNRKFCYKISGKMKVFTFKSGKLHESPKIFLVCDFGINFHIRVSWSRKVENLDILVFKNWVLQYMLLKSALIEILNLKDKIGAYFEIRLSYNFRILFDTLTKMPIKKFCFCTFYCFVSKLIDSDEKFLIIEHRYELNQ